jgi:anti-sigma regulatory factor (Ser/Thr protein kinase)
MSLRLAGVHNVTYVNSMHEHERIGDEAAVTPPPERFGAHDRGGAQRTILDEGIERLTEGLRLHVVRVSAKGGVAQRDVGTVGVTLSKSPKLAPPLVGGTGQIRHPLRHPLGPNVRMRAAFRNAAHVDHRLHSGAADQRGKLDRIGGSVAESIQPHTEDFGSVLSKIVVRCFFTIRSLGDVAIRAVSVSGSRAWTLSIDDASAGGHARSHFVDFLQSVAGNEQFLSAAELIFGELLGNVVRHAPGPVEIWIDLNDDVMVLHVVDSGPPLVLTEYRLPDEVLSERGRGLFIVAQLAADVFVDAREGGGNHISVSIAR